MAERPEILERLPGIGHRLRLRDEDGRSVVAVRRKDGTLQLDTAAGHVVLDATSARTLGGLAAGHVVVDPGLADRLGDGPAGLELDWVTLTPTAHAAGRTIEELAIRRRTGTTVLAVLRGSLTIVDPDPAQRLEPGDQLVVVRRPDDHQGLVRFLEDGG